MRQNRNPPRGFYYRPDKNQERDGRYSIQECRAAVRQINQQEEGFHFIDDLDRCWMNIVVGDLEKHAEDSNEALDLLREAREIVQAHPAFY